MYYVARIELSEKQNNAEYAKQYRFKRKLLLQHQASTSSETEILQKQKKAEYAKQRFVSQVWPIPTSMPLKSKRRQNTINNTD
jgi:hypothetical protein